MLEMAKVKAKYQLTGKLLTEAGLMRVASYQVTEFWERQRRFTTWLDCGNCSKEQRRKCREEDLYRECPKFRELLYLDKELDDGNGGKFTLAEFIADNKALDLDAWIDARRILRGLPKRLVQIGYKRYSGVELDSKDRKYLCKWLKTAQNPLF
jgi:hypothetical protein